MTAHNHRFPASDTAALSPRAKYRLRQVAPLPFAEPAVLSVERACITIRRHQLAMITDAEAQHRRSRARDPFTVPAAARELGFLIASLGFEPEAASDEEEFGGFRPSTYSEGVRS